MAVETATKIDDLVPAQPADGEPLSQGAAHLRVIKTAIQGTFPNFGDVPSVDSGIVTLTADEINALPQAITDENTAMQAEVAAIVPHVVPQGAIIMWSGSEGAIPAGWAICNGQNGTPDLRDRFIVGAGTGGGYAIGDTGGAIGASTDSQGAHDHGGNVGDHALTVAQMPKHRHHIWVDHEQFGPDNGFQNIKPMIDSGTAGALRQTSGSDYDASRPWDYRNGDPAPVDGIRGGEPTLGLTSYQKENDGEAPASYGQVHAHTISSDGDHSHSISDIRPPYYALAFIMKTTEYTDPTP